MLKFILLLSFLSTSVFSGDLHLRENISNPLEIKSFKVTEFGTGEYSSLIHEYEVSGRSIGFGRTITLAYDIEERKEKNVRDEMWSNNGNDTRVVNLNDIIIGTHQLIFHENQLWAKVKVFRDDQGNALKNSFIDYVYIGNFSSDEDVKIMNFDQFKCRYSESVIQKWISRRWVMDISDISCFVVYGKK